jgi:subtilisin family serine protease
MFAALALLLVSGCGRLPTQVQDGRGRTHASPSVIASAHTDRAIVRLTNCCESDALAQAFDSHVIDLIPELSLALLRTPSGLTTEEFVDRLKSDSRVILSESDAMLETAEGSQSTVAFSESWRFWEDVADQSALARVGAPEAQMLGRGAGALVAIIDTGIDLDHPALAAAIDLPGVEPGVTESPGDDRPEALDTNGDGLVDGSLGHGTHVAGIVHAMAPEARLLPVRVLDSDGVGVAFRVAQGIVAAVARGADVINLSLGLSGPSHAVESAIYLARSAGVVVVAAAGNSGVSTVDLPAGYPSVLAIAGTDADDHKAEFSDFGGAVDLAAPAEGILSTYWDGTYARWSGTSMASPFVAGTAALLYGYLGARSPDVAATVERVIAEGATPLGGVDPVYGGLLGAGRLSATGSVARLLAPTSTEDPERMREAGH